MDKSSPSIQARGMQFPHTQRKRNLERLNTKIFQLISRVTAVLAPRRDGPSGGDKGPVLGGTITPRELQGGWEHPWGSCSPLLQQLQEPACLNEGHPITPPAHPKAKTNDGKETLAHRRHGEHTLPRQT